MLQSRTVRLLAMSLAVLCGAALPVRAVAPPAADAASPGPETASARRGEVYTHLMRSLLAIHRLEYPAAVEELHLAVAVEPESADLLVEAAKLLTLMHRDGEAERLARRALTLTDGHRGALLLLADRAAERAGSDVRSRDEAIRLYGKLADPAQEPADPEVLRKLAELQVMAADLPAALDSARRLVTARPGDKAAIIMLTELLLRAGRGEEALRAILEYAAGHPGDEELIRWGRELVGRFNAWALVDEVLTARAPFNTEYLAIQLLQAEAQDRLGRATDAAATLERARAARPDDLLLRRSLVLTYRKLGRMSEAVELVSGLIRESPDEPIYLVWLGDTLENQHDVEGALSAYERAIAAYAGQADHVAERDAFRQRMVLLYLDRDELDAARAVLGQMEQPASPLALETEARLAIRAEDWPVASRAAHALKEAGQEGVAALLEGQIAVAAGHWSEAERRFAESTSALDVVARSHIAELYRRAGRPELGEQVLRDWVREQPESADARYYLGTYLYRLGRVNESEREMRQAFGLDPRHAPALNFVGYSLAERKLQLDEALALIRRALEVDAWNAAYLDSLGWVYYQMGRLAEARSPLERASRELPYDPTILEHLGDLYLSLGERSLALSSWDRALAAGPENPEAVRRKIADARAAGGAAADAASKGGGQAKRQVDPPSQPRSR